MADKQIYNFANDIEEVEISSIGAKITVSSTDETEITAEYANPCDKPEFCAVLCGKRLTLKEKPAFKLFCPKNDGEYYITVRLPKTMYKKIKINSTSGGADISSVNAENFELNVVSGNVSVQNIQSEKYSINCVSGKTSYSGVVGEGNINVTSGNVDVTYAEWNNDLKISAVSGNINVTLPDDSGADIKFDGVSGTVKTNLNNTNGSFMNLGRGTNGEFGGSNKHKVNINLVSGKVTLAKNSSSDKPELF